MIRMAFFPTNFVPLGGKGIYINWINRIPSESSNLELIDVSTYGPETLELTIGKKASKVYAYSVTALYENKSFGFDLADDSGEVIASTLLRKSYFLSADATLISLDNIMFRDLYSRFASGEGALITFSFTGKPSNQLARETIKAIRDQEFELTFRLVHDLSHIIIWPRARDRCYVLGCHLDHVIKDWSRSLQNHGCRVVETAF